MLQALVFAAGLASAVPCITATRDCLEWVAIPGKLARLRVYRNYGLQTRNAHVTRALVFVHGIIRDADNHFRTALAAAFLDDALGDTDRRPAVRLQQLGPRQ